MGNNKLKDITDKLNKDHHTFVKIWLGILIFAALLTCFLYITSIQGIHGYLIGILSILNVFLIVQIINFKKYGFYGYILIKLIIIGIIIVYMGNAVIVGNIIGLVVLYFVLQIKSGISNKSSWQQLG